MFVHRDVAAVEFLSQEEEDRKDVLVLATLPVLGLNKERVV